MCMTRLMALGTVFFMWFCADVCLGQHTLERTITVDGTTDAADYTTIGDALNSTRFPDPITEKWTILIYPGEYPEAVTLGTNTNDVDLVNVDLVGVDRDAVIIKPPADTDAITIQGDGVRNNAIRNLTIMADDNDLGEGRGIVIEEQTTDGNPSKIRIANVTIQCDGEKSSAVDVADPAEDLQIDNVLIKTTDHTATGVMAYHVTGLRVTNSTLLLYDGKGVWAGDDCQVTNTIVIIDTSYGTTGGTLDDTAALLADGKSGLRVTGCHLEGRRDGIRLIGDVNDAVIADCQLRGSHYGAFIKCGDDILFQNCTIFGDSTKGRLPDPVGGHAPDYHGVFINDTDTCDPGNIRFIGCEIKAFSGRDTDDNALGIALNAAPASSDGPVRFVDCTISSEVTTDGDRSFGVVAEEANAVLLIGGSVSSLDGDERQTDQYDLLNPLPAQPPPGIQPINVRVTRTGFSKWKGTIGPASRAKSIVQRTVDVDAPDDDWILVETDLPTLGPDAFQEVDPSNQPDVYRTLIVTGVEVGGSFSITGSVFVVGTDWAGNRIAESFGISAGNLEVIGGKPFKTVMKIHLPVHANNVGKVKVGTTSKLGLRFPISATTDVQQQGRKASGVNSYTLEAIGAGDVDVTYATVDVDPITADDSFEWSVLASE